MGHAFCSYQSKMKKIIFIVLSLSASFLYFATLVSAATPPVITPVDKYLFTDGSPARIAAGSDGKLYVTNTSRGTVSVYSNNGLLLYTLTEVEAPLGIHADAAGRLYISDIRSKYVGVYSVAQTGDTQETTRATLLFKLGKGEGEFQLPNAIAVSEQGNIYVVDSKTNSIKVYSSSGQALLEFGMGILRNPVGITIDKVSAEVYVIDYNNSCVRVFDPQGNLLRSIAQGSNVLLRPLGAAVDSNRLFVTDAYHSVITVFDKMTGTFLNSIGNYGNNLNEYATPIDLSLDRDSKLFITNSNNQRIEALGVDVFTGITIAPSALKFMAYRGGQAVSQSVGLNAVGTNTLWMSSTTRPWLSPTGLTGSTPASVSVTADPSGLAVGTYASHVVFKTLSGTESYLPVSLEVRKPALLVDATSLNLIYQRGSSEYPNGTLNIDSVGAVLNWKATPSKNWLVLDKSSGATPAAISLKIADSVKNFKIGSYTANIVIDAGDVTGSPATISVRLDVRKAGDIVVTTNLDQATFSITGPESFTGGGQYWTAENAKPGSYTISFNDVQGYSKPHARSFSMMSGKTAAISGTYARKFSATHIIAGSGNPGGNLVAVISLADGTKTTFTPFVAADTVKVAAGDLNGDGIDEIIATNGKDTVKIFDAEGIELASQIFSSDVNDLEVAVGDIYGTGKASIIAAYVDAKSKTSHLTMLVYNGQRLAKQVPLLIQEELNPVSIAIGDINGDGNKDLIAASKSSLKAYSLKPFGVIWNKPLAEAARPVISSGDIDGDGTDEIAFGHGSDASSSSDITIMRGDGTDFGLSIPAFDGYAYGVNVVVGDMDDDGVDEIIAGAGPGPENNALLRKFESDGTTLGAPQPVFESMYGAYVGLGNFGSR